MKKIIIGLISLIALNSALAGESDIRNKFNKQFPNKVLDKVEYINEVKLYELTIASSPVKMYTNDNFDFIFASEDATIIDPKLKNEPLVERNFKSAKKFFNSLPLDKALRIKYGTGERKIAIFSEPDCPYCRQLELMVASEFKGNATIHYFMNPIESLHPNARLKAKKIFCDPIPGKAWTISLIKGTTPENDGNCPNAALVDEHKKLAEKYNFTATPIILFDNGYIINKAIDGKEMKEILDKRKP